jgi:YspA, cpYpsA-related SLOG family
MSIAITPKCRVIIAGGRNYHNYDTVLEAIEESGFQIDVVVSGGASGVDSLGERYAIETNLPLAIFQADWQTHGRAAGPIRNRKMAENADALIAVWDGQSRGTKNMIETATKLGLLVFVKRV